jgi:hypothetical protein
LAALYQLSATQVTRERPLRLHRIALQLDHLAFADGDLGSESPVVVPECIRGQLPLCSLPSNPSATFVDVEGPSSEGNK